ncbi:LamG domain-containing protein [Mangrovivirga sp. M17]|uniref:LamG domain-containing protein n=1 Tax=Mangrovivirga halotolerans TaxID=2993936 RepID=A0ABT3RMW2_9BACT|nr:LamG domain-containing protein [Mangrovivirga halotolerans]MCX2742678.1 LamG domain-containing protein [Mangrovivirga halotolerans]
MRFNQLSQGLLALVFISVFSFITSCSDEEGTEPKNEEPEVIDIPRDGLVAFYPYNGNLNDESGVGDSANGGFYGTPKPAELTSDRYGNLNSAYKIETTNNLNAYPYDKFAFQGDISIAGWVKPKTSGRIIKTLIHWLEFDESNNNIYGITNIYGTYSYTKHELSNTEQWHSVAYTWDNTNKLGVLYVDGEKVSENVAESSIDGTLGTAITFGIEGFSGLLDDITIYNKVLSPNEINKFHTQTLTK